MAVLEDGHKVSQELDTGQLKEDDCDNAYLDDTVFSQTLSQYFLCDSLGQGLLPRQPHWLYITLRA